MVGIDFKDPVEMLYMLDDDLLAGRYELYDWQKTIMRDFAAESTSAKPYQAVARAANGSGKDKMLIAPCSVWLSMKYPDTTSVITSASGTQLDRQTSRYVKKLAEAANNKLMPELWKLNYRHYECGLKQESGEVRTSTIDLFVTDEAGRAEGWHPTEIGSQFAVFTSEAKSIPDEIFQALARCTGFTKRLDVSSPGLPMGHFFNRCTAGNWKKYHITAYECPHISPEYIEQCRIDYGGETSALFKSMILAEFGSTDEQVVIPYHIVWNAIFNRSGTLWRQERFPTAGLDLSAGGDETVLAIRNGNKLIKTLGFRFEDTARTVDHLEHLFRENGLQHPRALIFGDAGGLGKPILDQLRNRGWHNVRYVLNQAEARDKKAYYNRGTEMWFNLCRLMERCEVILLEGDELLKKQLASRFYKQTEGNRLLLESKQQARAKGHPSPDRADATVLAFSNYKALPLEIGELPIPARTQRPPQPVLTLKQRILERHPEPNEGMPVPYRKMSEDQRSWNVTELQRAVDEFNQRLRDTLKMKLEVDMKREQEAEQKLLVNN